MVDLPPMTRSMRLPPPYVPPHGRQPAPEEADPESVDFHLEGLISGPHVQKLNRNSIFLFVNGRLIRDKLLLHAISSAFHNLMPPGCYPFALLFLTCDPGEVDVNVHPAKTEVRFRHGSFVHDFVRDAIRETLMAQRPVSSMPMMPESPVPLATPGAGTHERVFAAQAAGTLPFSEFSRMLDATTVELPSEIELNSQPSAGELPEVQVPAALPIPVVGSLRAEDRPPMQAATLRRVPDTHGKLDHLPAEWERTDTLAALPDLRPLGQIHDSFIVAAARDGLWIIDQHVAHERILFEQVLRQRAAARVEVQQLLMPVVLQLSMGQQLEYARIADELNATGFETEPFGQRTIAVKAAPAGLPTAEIEKVVFEILETAEREYRAASMDEIRRDICATIACRAAIKINMHLEPAKIEWLLAALAQCEYPMTCPHGRPIALRYGTKDILRSFHRI
jgi:DNA mismatch repair protein MutL